MRAARGPRAPGRGRRAGAPAAARSRLLAAGSGPQVQGFKVTLWLLVARTGQRRATGRGHGCRAGASSRRGQPAAAVLAHDRLRDLRRLLVIVVGRRMPRSEENMTNTINMFVSYLLYAEIINLM